MPGEEDLVYPLPNGATLQENYTITNVLNAGGFGITYLALDQANSRYVVIKECMPSHLAYRDAETGDIFAKDEASAAELAQCIIGTHQEAQVIALFDSPGIVKVFDCFDAHNTAYYVMENIEGQTLLDVMNEMQATGTTIAPDQAKELLINILNILDYLHTNDIYHCDLKPGNIFILADGSPKLIDFGAFRSKNRQHQGLVQITPGYTPPEFYPGQRSELGPWCDIYELGACFYELLTGRVPEPADQRAVTDRNQKVTSIPALVRLYPLPFLSSIDKALSPDERTRFRTVQLWYSAITGAGNGALKTGKALNPALQRRIRKSSSSAGTVILIIFVMIAVILGICFWQGVI